ncbi:MAG: hypothetical protein MUC63_10525, partial [Planctomycetes bacterium]|nr:hypothetical protein [Planctomycetota bacterium]
MKTILMSLAILGLLAAGEARAEHKNGGKPDKGGKKAKFQKGEPGPGKHLKGHPAPGDRGPGKEGLR